MIFIYLSHVVITYCQAFSFVGGGEGHKSSGLSSLNRNFFNAELSHNLLKKCLIAHLVSTISVFSSKQAHIDLLFQL